ncbi:rod shape-determining protein MreC [Candidatus Pelagibacter ubique]|nr:rod shape-determining protein MreC [Candidatus Pelagibacter ubique]
MEPSRDDFVIALRSAFLKKGTQQRFSLLSLIFFSIVFLILGSFNFKIINYVKAGIKEVVYRSSFIVSSPENFIKNNYIIVQNHFDLYNANKKNELEIKKFKSDDISRKIIEFENIRLKEIINDYFVNDNEVVAKVLIDKKSPFLRSIAINKGSKDSIKLGMAVLDGIYFIGKVVEVNYSTSRVLLISDINSKIPVAIEPNNTQAIMSGNGLEKGIIEYINNDLKGNEIGDSIVFTSGVGGLFKSGIPIGRIIKKKDPSINQSFVNFYKDLSQLKYVKILSFKKENLNFETNKKKENNKVSTETLKNSIDENIILIKRQKEISDEIRLKLIEQNIILNEKLTKLQSEKRQLKKLIKEKDIIIQQETEHHKNKEFLELNLLYGHKCSKNNVKNILKKKYKIGSPEYKACVMSKGKN